MPKATRIDLRLEAEHKRLLMQAAALQGSGLGDFTISAALDKARVVVAEHQHLYLSQKAFDHLLSELERSARELPALSGQRRKVE